MRKKILFICLFIQIIHINLASAQTHTTNEDRLKKVNLEQLMAEPDRFSSLERQKIFNHQASKHFLSNMDSVLIIYQQMIEFGHLIKDNYVEGKGYVSLSEMYRIKGNHRKAIDLLKKGIALLDDDEPNSKSELLTGLADCYNLIQNYDSAAIIINHCIEYTYEKCDTAFFGRPHIIKGDMLARQEQYYSALDQYYKSLEYSDEWQPLVLIDNYIHIAKVYIAIHDWDNTIMIAHKALEVAEENAYKRTECLLNKILGANYRQKDDLKKSLIHLNSALPFEEKNVNPRSLISLYTHLVLTHLKLEQVDKAADYLKKAAVLLPKIKNQTEKTLFYIAEGAFYIKTNRYKKGLQSFKQVVSIGKTTGTVQRVIDGYEGLIAIYEKQKDWKNAYLYADSLKVVIGKLDLNNQKNLIYDLENRYESELKQAEIKRLNSVKALQDVQIDKKNRQIIFTIIGLLLALLAVFGIYYAYRTKNKNNAILKDKNTQLSSALATNKMLIKEIHHRVKNNLQVVSSLLNLQSRFEKDENVLEAINTGKNRVQTMSLLHQNLYANENLKNIKIKKYFTDLAKGLTEGYPLNGQKVTLTIDIDDIQLDIDQVVPLGLITNELITNALKYAYTHDNKKATNLSSDMTQRQELLLKIKQIGNDIELIVADNGIGIPFDKVPERSKSMGMQLIRSFSKKLKARIDINNKNGTEFNLNFSILNHSPNKSPFTKQ